MQFGPLIVSRCCQGSGIEAFARLSDSIFFQVNPRFIPRHRQARGLPRIPQLVLLQFISSRLHWVEQGVILELQADTPGARASTDALRSTLRVLAPSGKSRRDDADEGSAASAAWVVWVRVPDWAQGTTVRVEGHFSLPSLGGRNPTGTGAASGSAPGQVDVRPGTLVPVVFRGGATRQTGRSDQADGGTAPLGTLRLQWGMSLRWEAVQDTRPRFAALSAPVFGPLVLAGYTNGERAVSREAALVPVPAVARQQLMSLRVAASAALSVAAVPPSWNASGTSDSPATACLVTRWGQVWVLYADRTRSFLVSPPSSCVQRASPIGDEMSRWAQRSSGVGGGYRLSGALARSACDHLEGCLDDGTSPFAGGALVLMHNGTDMPLVLASDPPSVPGTRKGGTDAANAATWRVTPAPLDFTTVTASAAPDGVVPVGSDAPVFIESFDAPGYVLSAATSDGSLYLRRVGTRGHAQRWRMLHGAHGEGGKERGQGGEGTIVFQAAEAPGLVLSVESLATGDDKDGSSGDGAAPAPLLHRGAFASQTSRLVLAPNRPSSAAAQLLRAPAASEYPSLALWARPSGRGLGGSLANERRDSFLMVPLNEIVDEHFSVYFCRVDDGVGARPLPAFC